MINKHLIEQKGNKPNIKRYLLLIVFALFVNFLLIHSVAALSAITIRVYPQGGSTSTIIPGEEVTIVVPHAFQLGYVLMFPPGMNPPNNFADVSASYSACPMGTVSSDLPYAANMLSFYNVPSDPNSGYMTNVCGLRADFVNNNYPECQSSNGNTIVVPGVLLGDMVDGPCYYTYGGGNYLEFTSRNFSATPPGYHYTVAAYNQGGTLIGTAYIIANVSAPRPYTDTSASNAYADVSVAVNGQSDVRFASVPIGFPFDFIYGGRFGVMYGSSGNMNFNFGSSIGQTSYYAGITGYSNTGPIGGDAFFSSSDYCNGNVDGQINQYSGYFNNWGGLGNAALNSGGTPCYPGYMYFTSPVEYANPAQSVTAVSFYNASPDLGAMGNSGMGDFAAAGAVTMNGLINCTGVMVDSSHQLISVIRANSVYCVYYDSSNGGWSASSPHRYINNAMDGCEGYVTQGAYSSPPEGAFVCANGTVAFGNSGNNYYPALSSTCDLSSDSPNINCFASDYSGPALTTGICGPGNEYCIAGGALSLGPVTSAICSVYTIVNSILFILALTIMLIGGTLYAGAHVMPAQSRGIVQGYAMGMIIGGVVAVIIAMVAPWVLSIVTNVPISQITTVCTNI